MVRHHRLAHRQGEDRLRHAEAAGNPGADRARSLQPRRPGAGLLRRQRDHGRGRGKERSRLLHGGPERRGDCGDGKTIAIEGREDMISPSRFSRRERCQGPGGCWRGCVSGGLCWSFGGQRRCSSRASPGCGASCGCWSQHTRDPSRAGAEVLHGRTRPRPTRRRRR